MAVPPKRFQLNVGGTRYEVSDSLLDRFPDSMLRHLTSDRWNRHCRDEDNERQEDGSDDSSDNASSDEIFIERNGSRFEYVLDYMRDGRVVLPLSIPRQQLLADLEYYGIDCDESEIILGDDLFDRLSKCLEEKQKFEDVLRSKKDDLEARQKVLDARRRALAAEIVSHQIATDFFRRVYTQKEIFDEVFLEVDVEYGVRYKYAMEELEPHLHEYGLTGRFADPPPSEGYGNFYSSSPRRQQSSNKPPNSFLSLAVKMR